MCGQVTNHRPSGVYPTPEEAAAAVANSTQSSVVLERQRHDPSWTLEQEKAAFEEGLAKEIAAADEKARLRQERQEAYEKAQLQAKAEAGVAAHAIIEYFKAKSDQDKTRMDLIPAVWLEALGRTLTVGAGKYGENTWQTIPNAKKRYYGAALRHLMAAKRLFEDGRRDMALSDDGLPSLVQAAINCLFLFSLTEKP